MMKEKMTLFLVSVLFTIILTGCGSEDIEMTRQPTQLPTRTVTASATMTASPIQPTETPTITPSITPTRTPTLKPSLTPLPTLPTETARAYVLGLLEDNGGCQLPCWWGLTPGETDWDAAEQFLASFSSLMATYRDSPMAQDFFAFSYIYYLPEPQFPSYAEIRITIRSEKITQLNISGIDGANAYQIRSMLKRYGQPDSVWIFATTSMMPPDWKSGFSLVLYYDEGVFASYSGESLLGGNIIQGCVNELGVIHLLEDRKGLDASIVVKELDNFSTILDRKKPLQEVTDLSIERFYELFSKNTGRVCVFTPKIYWDDEPW